MTGLPRPSTVDADRSSVVLIAVICVALGAVGDIALHEPSDSGPAYRPLVCTAEVGR